MPGKVSENELPQCPAPFLMVLNQWGQERESLSNLAVSWDSSGEQPSSPWGQDPATLGLSFLELAPHFLPGLPGCYCLSDITCTRAFSQCLPLGKMI